MKISKKDIEYIANLSRIQLTVKEEDVFINQLNDILSYINKLNKLDTEKVKPLLYPLNISNVLRDDNLGTSFLREEGLSNAPSTMGGFLKVPKVIE